VLDCLLEYDVNLCLKVLSSSLDACAAHMIPMLNAIEHPPVSGTLLKL
jgi:hypothetical protein